VVTCPTFDRERERKLRFEISWEGSGGRETARVETGTETRPSVRTKTGLWIRYDVNHTIVKHFSILWISSFIMFCNEIRIYE
jgi:hypothetical protein